MTKTVFCKIRYLDNSVYHDGNPRAWKKFERKFLSHNKGVLEAAYNLGSYHGYIGKPDSNPYPAHAKARRAEYARGYDAV